MIGNSEKVKLAQELHAATREIRGRFLNTVAVVDIQLAELISHYFCADDDKRSLFMSEVATSQAFSLNRKIEILKKIVKKECGYYLAQNPKLFNEFDKMRMLRNDMAHATLDVSEAALLRGPTKSIGFVFFKDGKKQTRQVTPTEAAEYDVRAGILLQNLGDISKLLGFHATYANGGIPF